MNLLVDPCPTCVDVSGQCWPIRSDFRFWIMFEQLMLESGTPENTQLGMALLICFDAVPPDIPAAVEAMLWFYRGGQDASDAKGGQSGKGKRIYSFSHDDAYIYAAFLDQYGVDLQEASLHWWKFRAMFRALKADNEIVKIMGYRAMEIDPKMDEGMKKFYQSMKELYALPLPKSEQEKLDAVSAILAGDGDVQAALAGGGEDE